jgi:nitroimidazol reductase NimA-like FMN-containing flavoprotein (pyridoxamine 5'-phosphate oxidase superfamily)
MGVVFVYFAVVLHTGDNVTEPTHAEAGRGAGRAMSKLEIEEFLKVGFWGVMATSLKDEPYGVPIIYGYDEQGVFYVASGPGKKIQIVEQNPHVTLTVVELEDYGRRWRSVIIYGRVEIVQELGEKLHAFNTLRKQIPRPSARVRDAARLAMAKVIKIVPTEMTGKAIGY